MFIITHKKPEGTITLIYPSRTRKGLQHKVTTTSDLLSYSCSCEAGQMKRQCWHINHAIPLLEGIFKTNEVNQNEQTVN